MTITDLGTLVDDRTIRFERRLAAPVDRVWRAVTDPDEILVDLKDDVTPDQIEELTSHENLHAVKESSGNVRRVTEVIAQLGDRLNVFAGLDDMIVESMFMGASGWIAGLVNALPTESVELVRLAGAGKIKEARALYNWFLPLLRLDTVPEFVQHIKLVQKELGCGNTYVRPPRLELDAISAAQTRALLQRHLLSRPTVRSRPMVMARAAS